MPNWAGRILETLFGVFTYPMDRLAGRGSLLAAIGMVLTLPWFLVSGIVLMPVIFPLYFVFVAVEMGKRE